MNRIIASIKAYGPLNGHVSGRIYADEAPDTADLPYIVITQSASAPGADLEGATRTDRVRYTVDCWAKTRGSRNTMMKLVRDWVDGVNAEARAARDSGIYTRDVHMQGTPVGSRTDFANLRGASRGLLEYDFWLTV